MNAEVKNHIIELRKGGMTYKMIGQILGLKESTVKLFCNRNGVSETALKDQQMVFPGVIMKNCKNCGGYFLQYPGHREKIFCCDACRIKWWNGHLSQVKRKAMYDYTCPVCGKQFSAYGNRNRKYCSHECYIIDRFGSLRCE